MSAFLTQKEIDSVFAGGITPSDAFPGEAEVVPYDFVRPLRVPKDRRAALEAIYARFAFMLQMMLSSRLRAQADVIVRSIEPVSRGDLAMSLPSPAAAFLFRAQPGAASLGLIDWGGAFALYALDRLFGGPGDSVSEPRPLNALEQGAVRLLAERALSSLTEAWQENAAIQPELAGFESDPEALAPAGLAEDLMLAMLDVRSGEASAVVTVAIPSSALESFMRERVSERPPSNPSRDVESERAVLDSRLTGASLGVAVRMPPAWITTRRLLAIEPGQVLEIGHSLEGSVEVHVNGRRCYLGTLGRFRQRVGVKITAPVTTAGPERPGQARPGRMP